MVPLHSRSKLAGNALLILLALMVIFHVLVLVGLVPSEIVWGGRATGSVTDTVILESIAVLVTIGFAWIVAMKVGYIRSLKRKWIVTAGMWVIFAYFCLNVVGNLASSSGAERMIFTPVAVLMALLALRLAVAR